MSNMNWQELEDEFLAKERKWKNAQEPMGFWLVAFWTIVAGLLTGTGLWMWMR